MFSANFVKTLFSANCHGRDGGAFEKIGGWGVWGEGRSPCSQRYGNKKKGRSWAKPNPFPFWLLFLAPFDFVYGA
jgi:hypothetical protein